MPGLTSSLRLTMAPTGPFKRKRMPQENTVTKQDMNTCLAESARPDIDHRLLIATTRHVSPNATRAWHIALSPTLRHGDVPFPI